MNEYGPWNVAVGDSIKLVGQPDHLFRVEQIICDQRLNEALIPTGDSWSLRVRLYDGDHTAPLLSIEFDRVAYHISRKPNGVMYKRMIWTKEKP